MIKLLGRLPSQLVIAVSGGVDSMAVADFISRSRSTFYLAFFHHNTSTSDEAHQFLADYCKHKKWSLIHQKLEKDKPDDLSMEEFWRNERYKFLDTLHLPVVTAHHLDDCVETYIWGCLHGTPKVIPYQRGNVIRPFLLNKKEKLMKWASTHGVPYVEDPTNASTLHMRNYIRHTVVPRALVVNPGLHKVVKKKVQRLYSSIG